MSDDRPVGRQPSRITRAARSKLRPIVDRANENLSGRLSGRPMVVRAGSIAVFCTLVLAVLVTQTTILRNFEHWLSDWRVTLAAEQRESAHPDVALVLVREDSLMESQAYSPIDRNLLANLVERLDATSPRTIGLDFVFDMPTDADARLLGAIRDASAPVVLGAFEDRTEGGEQMIPGQVETQAAFLRDADRPYGFFNIVTDFDGVVRRQADPVDGGAPRSFADTLADVAGAEQRKGSERLAWLRPPPRDDVFATLYAEDVLALPDDVLRRTFEGRIVIVGAGLRSQVDTHVTPLNAAGGVVYGAEIIAQAVAQRLDGRAVYELNMMQTLGFSALVALGGALVTLWFHGRAFLDALVSLAVLSALDLALFAAFDTAAPLGALVISLGLSVWLADLLIRIERARALEAEAV